MTNILPIQKPNLFLAGNQVRTSSVSIANSFGKRHDDILKKISLLDCSESFGLRNFAESSYTNSQNKVQPMYEITRDGFVILAMGFTGKKAMAWKEAYIEAFNKMEAELLNKTQPSTQVAATLPSTITDAQQKVLQDIVDMGLSHIKDQQKVRGAIWGRFKNKFMIPRYNALPYGRFEEAASYLVKICREMAEKDEPLSLTFWNSYTDEDYFKALGLKSDRLSAKVLLSNESNSVTFRLLNFLVNLGFPVKGCLTELNALYYCLRDVSKINRLYEMATEDLKMNKAHSGYPLPN